MSLITLGTASKLSRKSDEHIQQDGQEGESTYYASSSASRCSLSLKRISIIACVTPALLDGSAPLAIVNVDNSLLL